MLFQINGIGPDKAIAISEVYQNLKQIYEE
jgi:hypothetical protein